MRRGYLLVASALAAAAFGWWYWTNDERRIIAAGREIAAAATIPANEPDVARLARVAPLSRLLAQDVRLVGPVGEEFLTGREAVLGLASLLRPARGLQVSIGDIEVDVHDDGTTATATTTVTMREPPEGDGPPVEDVRSVSMEWTEGEQWTLSKLSVLGSARPVADDHPH
jgi:SnoaL-like domain